MSVLSCWSTRCRRCGATTQLHVIEMRWTCNPQASENKCTSLKFNCGNFNLVHTLTKTGPMLEPDAIRNAMNTHSAQRFHSVDGRVEHIWINWYINTGQIYCVTRVIWLCKLMLILSFVNKMEWQNSWKGTLSKTCPCANRSWSATTLPTAIITRAFPNHSSRTRSSRTIHTYRTFSRIVNLSTVKIETVDSCPDDYRLTPGSFKRPPLLDSFKWPVAYT